MQTVIAKNGWMNWALLFSSRWLWCTTPIVFFKRFAITMISATSPWTAFCLIFSKCLGNSCSGIPRTYSIRPTKSFTCLMGTRGFLTLTSPDDIAFAGFILKIPLTPPCDKELSPWVENGTRRHPRDQLQGNLVEELFEVLYKLP